MFQYAAALSLATKYDTALKLDLSAFQSANPLGRTYALGHFELATGIETAIASQQEVRRLTGAGQSRAAHILFKLKEKCRPRYRRSVFVERTAFRVDPSFFEVIPPVYLWGYWQAVPYFDSVRDEVRNAFQFTSRICEHSAALAKEMRAQSSVALHVRRGDYVKNPETRRKHGTCSMEYYMRCVAAISKQVADPLFFVFSDEPSWVHSHLTIDAPSVVVSHNNGQNDAVDLYLMTQCKHHIIANSTFSWWAAWLSSSDNQIVYAPERWLRDPRVNTSGLIPANWNRM